MPEKTLLAQSAGGDPRFTNSLDIQPDTPLGPDREPPSAPTDWWSEAWQVWRRAPQVPDQMTDIPLTPH